MRKMKLTEEEVRLISTLYQLAPDGGPAKYALKDDISDWILEDSIRRCFSNYNITKQLNAAAMDWMHYILELSVPKRRRMIKAWKQHQELNTRE